VCGMPVSSYDNFVSFIQAHFTDGLVVVVGSGLSCAEGISGMEAVAKHLSKSASELLGAEKNLWKNISEELSKGIGLEAALLKHAPSASLEGWIIRRVCKLLIPQERAIIAEALNGNREFRFTSFLKKVLKPTRGLPILTTNYDRLLEVACELAGFHVDTTAVGQYAGSFDHGRSCMASCKGIVTIAKRPVR
jgi:NAD-dependent SIR2 family protein deacetylase